MVKGMSNLKASSRNAIITSENVTQVTPNQVGNAIKSLLDDTPKEKILSLLSKAVMEVMKVDDWAGLQGYGKMIENGIYTPMQILFHLSSKRARVKPNFDYPFQFGTIGYLVSTLTNKEYQEDRNDSERYRKFFQTLFQMRELKEEGENLSIETYIPDAIERKTETRGDRLNLKKLGLVFGRGTAIIVSTDFPRRNKVEGTLYDVFKDHLGAPSSILYKLRTVGSNVPDSNLSVSLKRDRTITIGARNNPLLEFYDGGWHIVDLNSSRALIDYCIDEFDDIKEEARESEVTESVLALAYHMATHWHSGILCVINYDKAEKKKVLEDQSAWSKSSTTIIQESLKKSGYNNFKITETEKTGYGRIILTNAIQDGATVFLPDGTFHSSGRVVKNLVGGMSNSTLGTGNRAAKSLSGFGIALKISKDGGIRLYSSRPDGNTAINNGLRIR